MRPAPRVVPAGPRRHARRTPRRRGPAHVGLAALLAVVPLPLAGCGPTTPTPPPTASPTHSPDAGDPIVVNSLPLPARFDPTDTDDPYTGRIAGLVQRGLFRYDAKGKAVPEVAASVESTDHRVYEVTLAPGWRFSDGEPVTADSFVDAWNRLADPTHPKRMRDLLAPVAGFVPVAAGTPGRSSDATDRGPARDRPTGRSPRLAGLTVTGARTFTITLTHPHPGFEQRLGHVALAPLPDVAFTDPDRFATRPVGNGPYLLPRGWSARGVLPLRPSATYTAGDPALNSGIDFRPYTDPARALRDVRDGRLDVLDVLSPSSLPTLRATFAQRVVDQPVGRSTGLAFPVHRAPWTGKDGSARRTALSMAIDREALAVDVHARTRDVATDLAPPVVEGHSPDLCGDACTLDPETAAEILDGVGGLPGGFTIAYAEDIDEGPTVTAICADVVEHLRVRCTGRPYPTSEALRTAVASGEETGPHLATRQMAYPLLESFLVPRFLGDGRTNDTGYADPITDAALGRALATEAPERTERLRSASRRILTSMPVVPLLDVHVAAVSSPAVTDVRYDVFGSPAYTQIRRPREG
ncbi:peptide ABC transporter substrate-binding protein [Mobilicoccus pelagius]|uniref:Putative peptide ABC transporter substrate-binding protein n=1 Tax=Mobilicoccus pelagius NBRC 104925 TaxID=1089455 RepID=H5UV35_9MICO|nr:ABC transporter substrate-binding protein [Mobilicoccus pelagius]GAB49593.1 putative peptide ABC transporter substrate-binding protein [Mobilicoccus pelagius NBRC 104925]